MNDHTPSLVRNFIMNAILGVANFLFPLIVTPYVSRVLLPEGTGKVAFATSLIACFNLFARLGVPVYGIRACARVRDNREELTRTAHELLAVSIGMSLLVYAVLFAALIFIPRLREERTLYLVVSLTILLEAVGMEWLYKGLEQYTYITLRSVLFKGIAVAALFLLVHRREDYVIYGAVTVLASSGSYLCNLFHARDYIDIRPGAERLRTYRPARHLRQVLVFFGMSCATAAYTQLDTVMLGFMATDADVGYYNAAVQVKGILVSLAASLGNVLLPRGSYYVEHGMAEEFRRIGRRALNFMFLAAAPMAVYFLLYARPGILFLSGPAFEKSVPAMRIIMPTLLLIGITNILGIQILVPLGREKTVLFSEAAGAVTDLILNLILIPRLGAAGAAFGTLAAEAVVLFIQYVSLTDAERVVFKGIQYRKILAALGMGAAVSGLAMLLCGPFLRSVTAGNVTLGSFLCLVLSAVSFFGAYGATLLLLKEKLTAEAVSRLREVWGRVREL